VPLIMKWDIDYVLCECDEITLKDLITKLEPDYEIQVIQAPEKCMTMLRGADTVEKQPFYLGEILTSTCEVAIQDCIGYGICVGDSPVRAYCIAVVDALRQLHDANWSTVEDFISAHGQKIHQAEKLEFNRILQTRVDFKLMEEE